MWNMVVIVLSASQYISLQEDTKPNEEVAKEKPYLTNYWLDYFNGLNTNHFFQKAIFKAN